MVDSLKYQRDTCAKLCQLRKCLLPECHTATLCPVVGWYLCFQWQQLLRYFLEGWVQQQSGVVDRVGEELRAE